MARSTTRTRRRVPRVSRRDRGDWWATPRCVEGGELVPCSVEHAVGGLSGSRTTGDARGRCGAARTASRPRPPASGTSTRGAATSSTRSASRRRYGAALDLLRFGVRAERRAGVLVPDESEELGDELGVGERHARSPPGGRRPSASEDSKACSPRPGRCYASSGPSSTPRSLASERTASGSGTPSGEPKARCTRAATAQPRASEPNTPTG